MVLSFRLEAFNDASHAGVDSETDGGGEGAVSDSGQDCGFESVDQGVAKGEWSGGGEG